VTDLTHLPYSIELRGGGINDGKRRAWRGHLPETVRFPEDPSATAAGVQAMVTVAEPHSLPRRGRAEDRGVPPHRPCH
jgi:hypothetical protein